LARYSVRFCRQQSNANQPLPEHYYLLLFW
jgi:hypothetical protein